MKAISQSPDIERSEESNTGGAVVSIKQMIAYDEHLTSRDFPSR